MRGERHLKINYLINRESRKKPFMRGNRGIFEHRSK